MWKKGAPNAIIHNKPERPFFETSAQSLKNEAKSVLGSFSSMKASC
jgi:hypothetical protein